MSEKSISNIADGFGLTLETTQEADHSTVVRVLKGVNQIFAGTEEAVRTFLDGYEKERPDLIEMSMYGYRE